jgi:tungstate transport system substrate-binding protein
VGAARLSPVSALALGLALLCGGASIGCADRSNLIVLGATTSTYDSGLLDSLIARFKLAHPGYTVRPIVVGSGQALELGRRGDVDVLLVHAPQAEERFMAAGDGVDRVPLMYNDFVLVGPPEDPAGVRGVREATSALSAIAASKADFVSRGDDSGTHERELELWDAAGMSPSGDWYLESGQGQGTSLQLSDERGAYTLVDRATFTFLRRLLRLESLVQGDPALVNLYSLIRVSRAAQPSSADVLVDWLTSVEGRLAIASFGSDPEGIPLFIPLVVGQTLPIPAVVSEPVAPESIAGEP